MLKSIYRKIKAIIRILISFTIFLSKSGLNRNYGKGLINCFNFSIYEKGNNSPVPMKRQLDAHLPPPVSHSATAFLAEREQRITHPVSNLCDIIKQKL